MREGATALACRGDAWHSLFPQSRREPILPTFRFPASRLQNSEPMNVRGFSCPVWEFVMAARADRYTYLFAF